MFNEYNSISEVAEKIKLKKIVYWSKDELKLEDGTIITIECSENDCCAWAGGEFEAVKLDAVITDIQIIDKGYKKFNGDGNTSYAQVVIYHNQNEIAVADCTADDGNGGYYYSVCALRVGNILCAVTDA